MNPGVHASMAFMRENDPKEDPIKPANSRPSGGVSKKFNEINVSDRAALELSRN